MPIDSYQDALLTSYVTLIETVSPPLRLIRQSRGVASMLTSQLVAPAGS